MVNGGHRGFDHSKIIARLIDKHLVDISCPGSSWPSLSEKPNPTHFCERDFRNDPALIRLCDKRLKILMKFNRAGPVGKMGQNFDWPLFPKFEAKRLKILMKFNRAGPVVKNGPKF